VTIRDPGLVARARIAVACSGLGHVQRGIEAWAQDLERALVRAGLNATLFGGAPAPDTIPLPCLRRTGLGAKGMARALRNFGGWRHGFGSPYEVEQTSFCLALFRKIRHEFDILHVQDPAIALWMERARRSGLSRARVIYANGTGEDRNVMDRFDNLQLLTDEARTGLHPRTGQSVFMVPNFIDTNVFRPGDQHAARAALGLPGNATIVLSCAAIRRPHKRIDALLQAFSTFLVKSPKDVLLVIAGSREEETDELIAEGKRMLGEKVRFLPAMPRVMMPELYRAADVFALASLQEMFGIVLLEAMATGLPVLCHDTPSFRSIVGNAGLIADISTTSGFAEALRAAIYRPDPKGLSRVAREHVENRYAEAVVIQDIISMYEKVLVGTPA
jgi:1,2-diacylglycerol 3-alpha-glucosyltransferase